MKLRGKGCWVSSSRRNSRKSPVFVDILVVYVRKLGTHAEKRHLLRSSGAAATRSAKKISDIDGAVDQLPLLAARQNYAWFCGECFAGHWHSNKQKEIARLSLVGRGDVSKATADPIRRGKFGSDFFGEELGSNAWRYSLRPEIVAPFDFESPD